MSHDLRQVRFIFAAIIYQYELSMKKTNTSISNIIKETLLGYMDECPTGLVIAPLPTAVGKTYSSCQAIAEYMQSLTVNRDDQSDKKPVRKIIWVTTLIKVLPEKELREAFAKRNLDYDSLVLRVKSNKDCITDFIGSLENGNNPLPDDFKTNKHLVNMQLYLKEIKRLNHKSDPELKIIIKQKEESFAEEERKFRRDIKSHLLKVVKTNNLTVGNKRINIEDLLYRDSRYSWVSLIYPHAREKNYRVLLMTTKKLVLSKPLFTGKQGYISEEWLKNTVIFVDEFDATKPEITEHIVEETTDIIKKGGVSDFKKMFLGIVDGLKTKKALDYNTADVILNNDPSSKVSREKLIEEADHLIGKYHLENTFRTKASARETRDFMYYCSTWITTHKDDGKSSLWGVFNPSKNVVELQYGTAEEMESKDPEAFSVRKMFNDTNTFIRKFISFINSRAARYMDKNNSDPSNLGAEITLEEALKTLLFKFNGLDDNQKEALLFFYRMRKTKSPGDNYSLPYSFYRYGATWYSLENRIEHNEDTVLRMGRVTETAENIMSFIARNALVIGLSATANCQNNLGNYNLDYIKNELKKEEENGEWNEHFHDMLRENRELAETLKSKLKFKYQKYNSPQSESHISIDIQQPLSNSYDIGGKETGATMEEFLSDIPKASQLARKIENIIVKALERAEVKEEDSYGYFYSRYINIAKIIFTFAGKREHQSCLCVNMKMPGGENSTLSTETINDIIKAVNSYYKKNLPNWSSGENAGHDENVSLFVLSSNDFEREKANYLKRLANGERLFILSTYATVGAGINLQHPICEWVRPYLVKLDAHEQRDDTKKDIDELAMMDLTNMVVNLSDRNEFDWDSQIKNIIQMEESYESGLINFIEKRNQINTGFRAVATEGVIPHKNILNDTDQISLHVSHWVIQVDGRTKRTLWRNRTQTIYIDEKVLARLNTPYIGEMREFLSEEMKALLDKHVEMTGEKQGTATLREPSHILEAAVKCARARNEIHRMISAIDLNNETVNWIERDARNWPVMGRKALRHPLPTDAECRDRFYGDFYFNTPDGVPRDSYFYYQEDDYQYVNIGLGNRIEFETKMRRLLKDSFSSSCIHEMSRERTRLPILLKYTGMEDHFKQMDIDTVWKPSCHMPTPVIFQERILGGLGEAAGAYILQTAIPSYPLIMEQMPMEILELFDFRIKGIPDVYVDFKHYSYYLELNSETKELNSNVNHEKILKKMRMCGARTVFVIGVISPDDTSIIPYSINNVHYIPGLIDREGQPVSRNLQFIISKIKDL